MKGTILQPTYLPWIGYFEMIASTDIYIVFDHIQFVKKSWQHRNRIKTSNGVVLLTIPIKKSSRNTVICDILISYDNKNQLENHWRTISLTYKNAPYFDNYKDIFHQIYSQKYKFIKDLNVKIIKTTCEILDIKTKFIFSSKLNLRDENMGKTEKIVNLCKKMGITFLYDAKGAQEFIDTSLFHEENISIAFQNYEHPVYSQLFGEFVPYMSVIDLLFNEGPKSLNIIRKGRRERY